MEHFSAHFGHGLGRCSDPEHGAKRSQCPRGTFLETDDGWNTLSPRKINAALTPHQKATLMEKWAGGGVKDEAQTFFRFPSFHTLWQGLLYMGQETGEPRVRNSPAMTCQDLNTAFFGGAQPGLSSAAPPGPREKSDTLTVYRGEAR